jgi:hypothetical protein
MRKSTVRKIKADKEAAVAARAYEKAEHERRWGIQDDGVDDEKVRLFPMIIDLEKSSQDNFTMISNAANDWLYEQPESRVSGVPEAIKVALTSHRTGVFGGIGSPEHTNAVNAMTRFRDNSTKDGRIKATKAAWDLLVRLKDQFNNDLFRPPDQAATSEEVIDFFRKRGGSEMVQ